MLRALAESTRGSILFTFAPQTPPLAAMLGLGRLFPRGDRSPAILPVRDRLLRTLIRNAHARRADRRATRDLGELLHQPRAGGAAGEVPPRMSGAPGARFWNRLGTRFLPFADAATDDLPLGRILRLSLFQVSVGMAAVLLTGTLNRVMIVELGMSAVAGRRDGVAPAAVRTAARADRLQIGSPRSLLGWKRVPYIWFGTLMQFGGLAILPFALLVMTGGGTGPAIFGQIGAAPAFLLVGAGMHTTQTAGLALATDLAPEHARPRVVALLYVMLLVGDDGQRDRDRPRCLPISPRPSWCRSCRARRC